MRASYMPGRRSHIRLRLVCGPLVLLGLLAAPRPGNAQHATVSGFVRDAATGIGLEGASVTLQEVSSPGAFPDYGAAARAEGLYILNRIPAGSYRIRISFVGFETFTDTLELRAGIVRTVTVALGVDPEALDEVLIETDRTSGLARITAGHQRIRPEDIEAIPSPDVGGDLANYLASLPTVVTSGDRGGQFFVRGGEPTQNLVLLDGIIVYQPFHLMNLYSAFPAEIIDRVEFYAGGFGAKYAERLSSVIDVTARPGNPGHFTGSVGASPFLGTAHIEGPISPGRASFLLSARHSFIQTTASPLYGQDLPFRFGDFFGKLHATPWPRHHFSLTTFGTADRGNLVPDLTDVATPDLRWSNQGLGARWLMLSRRMPIATELTYSLSWHDMEQGAAGSSLYRFTRIRNSRLALLATFSEGSFLGGTTTTQAGWDVVFARTSNEIEGLFQNAISNHVPVPAFGFFVEPEFLFRGRVRITPSLRIEAYNVRLLPYLEPRLRIQWTAGRHHMSAAAGIYQQQLVGINDRRDAASVFTVWTGIPRQDNSRGQGVDVLKGRIGSSAHAILGYRSAVSERIDVSVEGFYKYNTNLFVGEWTAFPQLTTRLQPATGRSFGAEARVEHRGRVVQASLAYGYSNTRYAATGEAIPLWFGTEKLRYRPGHDRQHQVTGIAHGSIRGVEVSLRWQFGSGLPYTRPLAFDGFALVDGVRRAFDLEHARRVIFERPFDSVLPTYHRLDVSAEKQWTVGRAALAVKASVINVYDRRNLFYVDTFTLRRIDQLPFLPTLGFEASF